MTFGSSYREVRKTEGSRNWDSTVLLPRKTAVKPPLPDGHLPIMNTFHPAGCSIHSHLFKPLYNGQLSTTVTFPQQQQPPKGTINYTLVSS